MKENHSAGSLVRRTVIMPVVSGMTYSYTAGSAVGPAVIDAVVLYDGMSRSGGKGRETVRVHAVR